eukprot:TRINITY_DN1275_c1_g2_i2.p1 TRINITY_DN1275_c1_g2~~TRINITY_DN1275_c1_g2_i2.p1  ORF type:complete len:280 (+),score=79.14 TRINITY_DN1275_c1_g2_i2:43-840(+)
MDANAWKEKGNALLKAGDKEGALDCYTQGVAAADKEIEAFTEQAYEKLEPLRVLFGQLCANRAHVNLQLDRPADALEDCHRAVHVDWQNCKAYWRGATAALQLDDIEAAAELLRQGLQKAWGQQGSNALVELLGKSIEKWKEAAAEGNVAAQHCLAICYLKGNGVAIDREAGIENLMKAAQKGDEMAQQMLNEVGERKAQADPRIEVWSRAAAAGDPAAQFNLGLAYLKGEGVIANPAKCKELWTMAAEQGDEMARANLQAMPEP